MTRPLNKLLASDKTTDSDKQPQDADSPGQSVKSLAKELDDRGNNPAD